LRAKQAIKTTSGKTEHHRQSPFCNYFVRTRAFTPSVNGHFWLLLHIPGTVSARHLAILTNSFRSSSEDLSLLTVTSMTVE